MAPTQFDYIIVGGGSAGSALAARLSADATTRVLVLEAGRPDFIWDPFIHMPAALTFPIGSQFYDWKYESEPEPFLNGRRIYHARGKVLGGSSSINGMIFQRGNPLDYERWGADPGMSSWDYAHCLPYFKRMENCLAAVPGTEDEPFRGHDGPLTLERGPATNPLFGAFFSAVQEAGYSLTNDVNGYRQEGFAAFDRNISRGRRLSAARAYLHPAMSRPNLKVVTMAHTTRILFSGTRATGVEFVLRGGVGMRGVNVVDVSSAPRRAYGGEVIVCAGAFGSPQLLQLSGVGNAAELSGLDIDVVADLPGVGENLQDHLEVYIQYGSKQPVSVAPALKWRNRPGVALQWALARSGPGATNHFEAGGFARSNDSVAYPNLMFHFLPIAIRYDGSAPAGGHGYQVHIGPMYSDSRGSVKIKSTSPFQHPALRFNYLSTADRPAGVDRGDRDRAPDTQPARVRRVQRRRAVARAVRLVRVVGARVGRAGRGDRAPPLLHLRDGHRAALGHRPGVTAGARGRRAARRRRVRHALCDQRQYLRPGHDDRGKGGGSDRRQHAASGPANRLLPPQFGRARGIGPGTPNRPGKCGARGPRGALASVHAGWRPRPHDGTNLVYSGECLDSSPGISPSSVLIHDGLTGDSNACLRQKMTRCPRQSCSWRGPSRPA